jgi:16S rRNA processing protein RimM
MQLTVARVTRARGLRGEVALDVRTDDPGSRLAPGSVLVTEPAAAGPLTVESLQHQGGRWFATFREVGDRTAAESLRGVALVVDAADSDEDDAWYEHQLAGLRAELRDGTVVGEVVALEEFPAHDMLVVREPGGERTLVPFVRAIVPVVDVAGGRVVLDPPGGLLARDAEALVVDTPDTPGAADVDVPDAGGEA